MVGNQEQEYLSFSKHRAMIRNYGETMFALRSLHLRAVATLFKAFG